MARRTRRPAAAKTADDTGSKRNADQEIALEIPFPADGIGSVEFWQNELTQSALRMKEELPEWRENIRRLRNERPALNAKTETRVNVDYYNTQQKRAELFYQNPSIRTSAKRTAFEVSAPAVEDIMNDFLGPNNINAVAMMDDVLFDVLCPAGIAASKIGYDRRSVEVAQPTGRLVPQLDPVTNAPVLIEGTTEPVMVPAVGPDGEPETAMVPRIIWDQFYWNHIEVWRLRIPSGFFSARYDRAPWLAWKLSMDGASMAAKFKIDERELEPTKDEDTLLSERDKKFQEEAPEAIELFYKAAVYDGTEINPERVRRIVFVNGKTGLIPVIHENSKDQEFDKAGAFVRGVKGLPIRVLSLRADGATAYPKSDCSMARQVTDELSTSRTQMIKQRNSARPVRGFNKVGMRKETVKQIEEGDAGELIGFDGDPRGKIVEIASAQWPRENFQFAQIIGTDIERLWAMGSPRVGVQTDGIRSATEIEQMGRGTDTRMAKERERVLRYFVEGAYQVLGLLQMWADETRTLERAGEDGAPRIFEWTKQTIQGEFAFALRPDSSVRTNQAEVAERQLRFNNLTANNPNIDQFENAKDLARAFGRDPFKLVRRPNPPAPPPPEAPKVAISLRLEPKDLQNPEVLALLAVASQTPGKPDPAQPIRAQQGATPVSKADANLTGRPTGRGPMPASQ